MTGREDKRTGEDRSSCRNSALSIHWTREPVYASGWKGQEAEVQPNQWHALLKDRIEEATKRTYELGEHNRRTERGWSET